MERPATTAPSSSYCEDNDVESNNKRQMQQRQHKVAIIGAGVAGCAAAAALHDYGIDFCVLDRHERPGGLWADNYPGAKVQSTAELYEYPCKKFPEHIRKRKDPPAPTANEVCDYLTEFINEKNIMSKFHFNINITNVVCLGEDEWKLECANTTNNAATSQDNNNNNNNNTTGSPTTTIDINKTIFTFVIVCNGLVSSKPNVFPIPGMGDFQARGGKIVHSSLRRHDDILEQAKRVLVIGNGKSAVDAAAAAANIVKAHNRTSGNANKRLPPIQLARRQTWYVPRYILGLVQYKWAFHTRIGSALLPRYYESNHWLLVLLHMLFRPIKCILWRIIELFLLLQYRLPYRLWPRLGTVLQGALDTSVLITDEEHLRKLRKGEIDMRIGQIEKLKPNKAILTNGDVLEDVDVVVLATGWRLSYDQFMDDEDMFAGLSDSSRTNANRKNGGGDGNDDGHDDDDDDDDDDPSYYRRNKRTISTATINGGGGGLDFCEDGLWLYRNILPANFKGMAFVGANTLTFMNIYTSYIQAYWLAQLLAGQREWPTEQHMKDTIQREKEFKRKYYKSSEMRGASVEAYMQHYHDVLFREMKAKSPYHCLVGPIANWIFPVLPSTMKGCLEPPQQQAATAAAATVSGGVGRSNTQDISNSGETTASF